MTGGINIKLDVVGLKINDEGKLCFVIELEGKRWELEVIGMDVNQEWILKNGKGIQNRDRGAEGIQT